MNIYKEKLKLQKADGLLFKRDSQRLGYTSPEELAEWDSFD